MPAYSRRQFIGQSGKALAAAAAFSALPGWAFRRPAPSDTLRIGLIGCRNMGFFNLENHLKQPGVVCAALCDVDEEVLRRRAADVETRFGQKPVLHKDFRKLLDDPEIDAVIIGTPDHWHCLQMVMACEAGKDVYVEKPMANSIAECQIMVAAARRYSRVVQVGQQQRSGAHWQEVVQLVRSGKLGTLRQVKLWGFFDYGKGNARVADSLPPAGLDYDLWLGPAPVRPYNEARLHGAWRHQWDYGGGLLTDWGVHLLDIPIWALNLGVPKSVSAAGGIYAYADREIQTPDTLHVLYQYDGLTVNWEHAGGVGLGYYGRNYGMAFIGVNGTLVVNREGWEVLAESVDGKPKTEAISLRPGESSNHEAHAVSFIDSIKTRRDPACTVEMGAQAALLAHMGNIASRTDSRLVWDAAKARFSANKAANELLSPEYRKPWALPKV
jgi:predicted dehydrogenase